MLTHHEYKRAKKNSLPILVYIKVNLISNRNIESKVDYELLRSYMGANKKEIKETKCTTVHDAVNKTVKNTPGGEFLKNVKLYIVERERHGLMWGKKIKERYFAAEGDVWGIKKNMNFRGFKVGDSVQWKLLMITKTGLITNLKNAVECTIREDETNKIYTVKYEALLKIE
jgi:hypothetical protein